EHEDGGVNAPRQAIAASWAPMKVLESHIGGLFPGWRLQWSRGSAKPGPKARIKNPYPTGPEAEWVDAACLDEDERELRRHLFPHRHLLEWRGRGRRPENVKPRIVKLAMRALRESATGSAVAWWSSAVKEHVELPHESENDELLPRIVTRW